VNIRRVPISEVVLWDKNPRGILKADFERLKRQIKRLGVYKPLVACEVGGSGEAGMRDKADGEGREPGPEGELRAGVPGLDPGHDPAPLCLRDGVHV